MAEPRRAAGLSWCANWSSARASPSNCQLPAHLSYRDQLEALGSPSRSSCDLVISEWDIIGCYIVATGRRLSAFAPLCDLFGAIALARRLFSSQSQIFNPIEERYFVDRF